MANENRISVIITADASGAITGLRLAGEETEKLGNRTQTTVQKLKSHWLEFTAGITGAYLALQKMWGWMEQAAQLEERMDTLNRLTRQYGMSADDLTGAIQRNSRGLIGMRDAALVATDALARGFTPEQVARMASWAETAQETAAETMTVGQAFRTMEQAITAARERGVVKMFGATIDLEAALGATAATMSKAQKAQALFNLVAEEAEKRQKALGEHTDSAADRMERFTNSINQAKYFIGQLLLIVGQPFMAVFNVAMTMVYGLAGAIGTVAATLARLTDGLGITKDKAADLERWAEKMYTNAAKQGEQALQNMRGAWEQIASLGAVRGGGTGFSSFADVAENRKRADQLSEILRKYAEERGLIAASEREKELVRLEFWFEEQRKKLHDLGAADAHYSELVRTYAEKRHEIVTSWANKTSEFYLEVQRKNAQENHEIEKERSGAIFRERERGVKERMAMEDSYAKAWGETESDRIRRKSFGEREILAIRQEALVASITEQTTFLETLKIMQQYRDLENEIAENKRLEVVELDARRVVIEREITNLRREQRDLLFDSMTKHMEGAFSGMPEVGRGFMDLFAIEAEQDPARRQFERWSALQDEKVLLMEEKYREDLERLRRQGMDEAAIIAETEAQKRAILDAYRQYDVQSDLMVQTQKAQTQLAYLSIAQGVGTALLSFAGSNAKAQFLIAKAVAVAMALVQAHVAAIGAAAAVASIPIVGPTLAAAAYAKWMAIGYINAALITATAIGQLASGGAGAGGGGSLSAGGGGPLALPQAPEQAKQETAPTQVVNIHIYGNVVDHDEFAREIIPSITKAMEDGVQ